MDVKAHMGKTDDRGGVMDIEQMKKELAELRAYKEAAEGQRPVCYANPEWIRKMEAGTILNRAAVASGKTDSQGYSMPLYAKPVPADKPAVPDEWRNIVERVARMMIMSGAVPQKDSLNPLHSWLHDAYSLLADAPSHSQQSAATVPADYRLLAEKLITKACCDAVERLSEIAPGRGWDSGETVAEMYIRQLRALSDRPSHESEQGGGSV